MNGLAVWMYGKRVGELSRQRGVLSFAYTPEAIELGALRPLLSVSMPTRSRPYVGDTPYAFFEGLLPEGESRKAIAYDFGVDESDALGLLRMIGRDCAGALIVIPNGETPEPEGVPEPITEAQVVERIRKLRISPLGVDERIRVSLAGMQDKLLLARLGDGWGLPVDGAPSTHIIKPAHPHLADMIANEAFCMRVARHLGVACAEVEIGEFDGLRALVIERYDRLRDKQHVIRLHQEDFCQAHALNSVRKYESGGGPSLRSCAEILSRWSSAPDQLERLLDISVLNVLVGNADAHAKNLSLLHSYDGQVRLAPAYDVLSTIWYEERVHVIPGMLVNGVQDIRSITVDDLVREAVAWGMPQGKAAGRVKQLLAGAGEAMKRAANEINPPSSLVAMLRKRARALTRQ